VDARPSQITAIEAIADPQRLAQFDLAILGR
jgi:hypothetical protein